MTIPHLIPPHPDMDRAMRRATRLGGREPWQMPLGMDAPARPAARRTIPGRVNWLVVPVGFSDRPFQTGPGFFDDLFFGAGKSVASYYCDQSNGKYNIRPKHRPSDIGVIQAPHPYSYYCNGNHGFGTFPQNTQGLFTDVVAGLLALNVDFRPYDNDGDGIVDGLVIVYAGGDASVTGDPDTFWAHMWSWSPIEVAPGLSIRSYYVGPEMFFQPEDMKIGIHAHEAGHLYLGLPDLYAHAWKGIGRWGLMANGAWNGSMGGNPAPLSVFSRIHAGFLDPPLLPDGLVRFLPGRPYVVPVEGSPNDYFTLEYMGNSGPAAKLPGHTLLITQVRDYGQSNLDPNNARIKIIECDGRQDLVTNQNYGEPSDVFPYLIAARGEAPGYWRRWFGPNDLEGTTSRWVDGRQVFSMNNIEIAPDGSEITANVKIGRGVIGDLTGDESVGMADLQKIVAAAFFGGELHPDMDLNGDRMIDSVDIQTLVDILRT